MANNGLFGTGIAPQDVAQVRITPAALPGSTYVAPQRREAGGNLQRLAQALGTLNGALGQYAQTVNIDNQNPNSDSNRAFLDSIQGMSMEQVAAKYPEAKNRIQKDGALALVGSKAASEFRNETASWYNTEFDQTNGNFAQEVEARRQKYAEGLGDPAMKAAFFRETENFVQKFQEQDTQRVVQGAVETRNTAVVDHFRNMIDDGLAAKHDPSIIAAHILKESSLSRDFYAMDGDAQNQTLFNIAAEYAQKGQTGLVKALLDSERVGSDGKKIGAVSKTAKYASKVADLVQASIGEEAKITKKESADTQFQIDDMKRQGSFDEKTAKDFMAKNSWYTADMAASDVNASKTNKDQLLASRAREEQKAVAKAQAQNERARVDAQVDAKGQGIGGLDDLKDIQVSNERGTGTDTYTADQQRKNYSVRLEAQISDWKQGLIDKGMDPKEADRQATIRTVNEFSKVKADHPTWAKEFSGIASSTTVLRAAEKGDVADHLINTVEKYNQIAAINPAYADTLVTNQKDQEFYDRYTDARQYGHLSPQAALLEAARGTHDTIANKSKMAPSKDEMDTAIRKTLNNLSDTVEATYADKELISSRVKRYVGNGMDISKATEKATKDIEDNSFKVHGRLVMDDQSLPKDAPLLFDSLLKDRFDVFGKKYGITDPNDLYLAPSGPGIWTVVSKELGGLPIGDGSIITSQDLGVERRRTQHVETARLEKIRSGSAAEKATALKEYNADQAWKTNHIAELRRAGGPLSRKLADFLEYQMRERKREASGFYIDPNAPEPTVQPPTP